MKKVNISNVLDKNSVHNFLYPDKHKPLIFNFAFFKLEPICIKDEFNNFFRDEKHYIEKISAFLGMALPLLSREDNSIFEQNIHKILDKYDKLEKILTKYGFSNNHIQDILPGAYQLEVPYVNGAMRIIVHVSENLVSFLFIDTNHHIYLNPTKTKQSGSLLYEFCPMYLENNCKIMNNLKTCYAFEFLDEQKFFASISYNFNPLNYHN